MSKRTERDKKELANAMSIATNKSDSSEAAGSNVTGTPGSNVTESSIDKGLTTGGASMRTSHGAPSSRVPTAAHPSQARGGGTSTAGDTESPSDVGSRQNGSQSVYAADVVWDGPPEPWDGIATNIVVTLGICEYRLIRTILLPVSPIFPSERILQFYEERKVFYIRCIARDCGSSIRTFAKGLYALKFFYKEMFSVLFHNFRVYCILNFSELAHSYGMVLLRSLGPLIALALLVCYHEKGFVLSELIPFCLSVLFCEIALYAHSAVRRVKSNCASIARYVFVATSLLSGTAMVVIGNYTQTGFRIHVMIKAAIFVALAACSARMKESIELASAGSLLATLLLWIGLQVSCALFDVLCTFIAWDMYIYILSISCACVFFLSAMITPSQTPSAAPIPIGQFFLGVALVMTDVMSHAAPVLPFASMEESRATAPSVIGELGGVKGLMYRGIQQDELSLCTTMLIVFYIAIFVTTCAGMWPSHAEYGRTGSSQGPIAQPTSVWKILAECVYKAKSGQDLSRLMRRCSQRYTEMSRSTVALSMRHPSEARRQWVLFVRDMQHELTLYRYYQVLLW